MSYDESGKGGIGAASRRVCVSAQVEIGLSLVAELPTVVAEAPEVQSRSLLVATLHPMPFSAVAAASAGFWTESGADARTEGDCFSRSGSVGIASVSSDVCTCVNAVDAWPGTCAQSCAALLLTFPEFLSF